MAEFAQLLGQGDLWPQGGVTTLVGMVCFVFGVLFTKIIPDFLNFHYVTTAARHVETTGNQKVLLARSARIIKIQKRELEVLHTILSKHNLSDDEREQIDLAAAGDTDTEAGDEEYNDD